MTSLVCGILKEIIQMNLLTKQKETQDLENELMVMGGRDGWRVGDGRVHTARLGRATNRDLLCRAGSSAQCHVAAWRGGRFGGGWMHVYVWLSPCAVPLKPSQHCIAINLIFFSPFLVAPFPVIYSPNCFWAFLNASVTTSTDLI